MIKTSTIILTLILLSITTIVNAQSYTNTKNASAKLREMFDKAANLAYTEPDKAIDKFEDIIKKDPQFIDAYMRLGYLYFDLKQYDKAIQQLDKAIAIDAGYETRMLFFAGKACWEMDKFEAAIPYLEKYINHPNNKDPKLKAKGTMLLESCRFAKEAVKNPVPFNPINLGEGINDKNAYEYLPSITADGETIIYTSRQGAQEDFYISKLVNGKWQKGTPVKELNTDANEGTQNIAPDGRAIFFAAKDRPNSVGDFDIYVSELKADTWANPVNMGKPINSAAWDSQPCISADGKSLYFASTREGGKGGVDIWVSNREAGGKWGDPQNLGDSINTVGDDLCPYLHPDGQTLYFTSDGHYGMGGRDIYVARKKSDGTWSKPQNIGYPINTKADEGALTISLDGKTGYYATDAFSGGTENKHLQLDIYSFEMPQSARPLPVTYVRAIVKDAIYGKLITAKVDIIDLASGNIYMTKNTNAFGQFLVCLPAGKSYALSINKPKYLFYSENFDLKDASTFAKPFDIVVNLQPIPDTNTITEHKENPPIILKNVFFETGSASLRSESNNELNRLKTLLDENPSIKIEIRGHTDNVGSESENLLLSENRAKAVYDYLIDKGISATRLAYKGYGETQPIGNNNNDEGRRQNRRTEFVLQ